MATVKNDMHAVQLIKDALTSQLHGILIDELMKEELDAYEEKLREVIVPMVEKVTLDSVTRCADVLEFRDELHVRVSVHNVED
jgi:hypothetical protein